MGNGLPELIGGRSDARGLKRILKEKRGRSIGGEVNEPLFSQQTLPFSRMEKELDY